MDYRYPIPKYCIFKEYILLSVGSSIYEPEHCSMKVPKKLLLEIAEKIKYNKSLETDEKCGGK